jgi:hypothetical protein
MFETGNRDHILAAPIFVLPYGFERAEPSSTTTIVSLYWKPCLLATLAKADPNKKYIRTGADAYSSDKFDPSDLAWERRLSTSMSVT